MPSRACSSPPRLRADTYVLGEPESADKVCRIIDINSRLVLFSAACIRDDVGLPKDDSIVDLDCLGKEPGYISKNVVWGP